MSLRPALALTLTLLTSFTPGCMTWDTSRYTTTETVKVGPPTWSLETASVGRKGEALEIQLNRVARGTRTDVLHTVDETSFEMKDTLTKSVLDSEDAFLVKFVLFYIAICADAVCFICTAPWVFPCGAIQGFDPLDQESEVPYSTPSRVPSGSEIVLRCTTPGVPFTLTAVHGDQALVPIPDVAISALRAGVGDLRFEVRETARPEFTTTITLGHPMQLEALDAMFKSAGPPEQRLDAWREVHALVPTTVTALRDSVYRRVQAVSDEVIALAAQRDAQRKLEAEQARLAAERSLQEEQRRLAQARKDEEDARRKEEEAKKARLAAAEAARVEAERVQIAKEEAEIQKQMDLDRRAEAAERVRLARLAAEERRKEQEARRLEGGKTPGPAASGGAASGAAAAGAGVTTSGAGASAAAAPQAEGQTFVLAIGINRYADGSIPALQFAENDAKDIFRFYATEKRSPAEPDRVSRLVGAEATRTGILKAIREKLARTAVNANDTAILFFAGHGFADARTTYIAPVDTELSSLPETAISASQLAEAWSGVRAGRKVLLVDACRSGGLEGTRGIGSVAQAPELAVANAQGAGAGGRAVMIAAAGPSELSTENADLEHGCFTLGLLNGLRGDADRDGDGRVTDQELGKFLAAEVPALAARVGGKQTPEVKIVGTGGAAVLSRAPKR